MDKNGYRPLFSKLDENLKRRKLWNSVEVHALYALFYTLCMSREGIIELRNYLGANDTSVFEPLFIAQYLLCPVNTIVNHSLVDWMMKRNLPPARPGSQVKMNDDIRAKILKNNLYLKYTLLVDLMKIVKQYGRKPEYDWNKDPDLSFIKNGNWGEDKAEDDTKNKFLLLMVLLQFGYSLFQKNLRNGMIIILTRSITFQDSEQKS
jgi:hypothetical protein